MRHAIRAIAVATGLACAATSARGHACGPPPTLRQYVASAEPILLVRAVERRRVPAEDCDCACDSRERVTFEVVESWTGGGPRTLDMDLYSDPAGPPPVLLLVGTYDPEEGGPPEHFAIHLFKDLDDPAVAVMRKAVERASVLARQGDSPEPGLLRIHIVESLLQAATRPDGLNEASRLAYAPEPAPLVLSDGEARDVDAAAVRDDLQGWELVQVLALLDEALSPELRALVLRRVDEAVASEEPRSYLIDPLLHALGSEHGPLLEIEDDVGSEDEALPGVPSEDEREVEEPTAEEMRRWQEEADRRTAVLNARWKDFGKAWPALRRTLVR